MSYLPNPYDQQQNHMVGVPLDNILSKDTIFRRPQENSQFSLIDSEYKKSHKEYINIRAPS